MSGVEIKLKDGGCATMLSAKPFGLFAVHASNSVGALHLSPTKTKEQGSSAYQWKGAKETWTITHTPSGAALLLNIPFKNHALKLAKALSGAVRRGSISDAANSPNAHYAANALRPILDIIQRYRNEALFISKAGEIDIKAFEREIEQI